MDTDCKDERQGHGRAPSAGRAEGVEKECGSHTKPFSSAADERPRAWKQKIALSPLPIDIDENLSPAASPTESTPRTTSSPKGGERSLSQYFLQAGLARLPYKEPSPRDNRRIGEGGAYISSPSGGESIQTSPNSPLWRSAGSARVPESVFARFSRPGSSAGSSESQLLPERHPGRERRSMSVSLAVESHVGSSRGAPWTANGRASRAQSGGEWRVENEYDHTGGTAYRSRSRSASSGNPLYAQGRVSSVTLEELAAARSPARTPHTPRAMTVMSSIRDESPQQRVSLLSQGSFAYSNEADVARVDVVRDVASAKRQHSSERGGRRTLYVS